jgi:hypothetical protein
MRRSSGFAGLLLAAALVVAWRLASGPVPAAKEQPTSRVLPSMAALPAPRSGLAASMPAAAPASPQFRLIDMARRHQLERERSRSSDYLLLVQKHLAEAHAGDHEAQLLIGEILQSCELVAARADSTEEDRLRWNCNSLIAAETQIGTATHWLESAAALGNGGALAALASDIRRSPGQRVADFRAALRTGDPSMLTLLALRALPPDTDKPQDDQAWLAVEQLAECDLGYDCAPSGVTFQVLCTSRARDCHHAQSVRDYYERTLRPQRLAQVQAAAAGLASGMRRGSDDWPEAQSLEQELLREPAGEAEAGESSGG